jgi:aromatic ring-opening dioxygenase catalytic subunit (LigB family)
MRGAFRAQFDKLEHSLVEMRTELADEPKAVLVVSGHWEEPGFAVSSSARPGMIYDYAGFPEELYRIRYGAPGSPKLAAHVVDLLRAAGIEARLDAARGFDHGTFSIMKPLYPDESAPVVQLSLNVRLDPRTHLVAGRALASLRGERVLIIGSGLSYHNLRAIWGSSGHEASRRFDAWLQQTLIQALPDERERALEAWEGAPCARAAHPREEHLMPLMVAVGAAAGDPGALTYHQVDFAGGITASSFRFGLPPARMLSASSDASG